MQTLVTMWLVVSEEKMFEKVNGMYKANNPRLAHYNDMCNKCHRTQVEHFILKGVNKAY